MATNYTNYVNPSNFQTVWIHHLESSDIDGAVNTQVPSLTVNASSLKGTWSLIVDGVVILRNYDFGSRAPTLSLLNGNSYEAGDVIDSSSYNVFTTNTITENVTVYGEDFQNVLTGSPATGTLSSGWVEATASAEQGSTTNGFTGIQNITSGITTQYSSFGVGSYSATDSSWAYDVDGNVSLWSPDYVLMMSNSEFDDMIDEGLAVGDTILSPSVLAGRKVKSLINYAGTDQFTGIVVDGRVGDTLWNYTTTPTAITGATDQILHQFWMSGNGSRPANMTYSIFDDWNNQTIITTSRPFGGLTDGTVGSWGIIENDNIITNQNTPSATTHTTTSNSTYTRKQLVSQYQGYNVYRMDVDNPDTTISRTRDVTVVENSQYRYYDVMATAAEEVENFEANVAVVFPIDIMMRRLETAFGGNQLDWSFIKVAENMNAANAEVLHLKETYGVTAVAVPLKMTIGANFVKITSNQLEDFDTFGAQTDDILQYYETENLQKVWRNVTLDYALSETYPNKIFMDYDTPSDRSNNLAFSSVQSICMFLDTNNNEANNYLALFNNYDTDVALSKDDAIFRVDENGDIIGTNNLTIANDATISNNLTVENELIFREGASISEFGGELLINASSQGSKVEFFVPDSDSVTINNDPIATHSHVSSAIAALVDGAPEALDTLNELAAAINDDASVYDTIVDALALKLDADDAVISTVGTTAPSDPSTGDFWMDTGGGEFYVRNNSNAWTQVNISDINQLSDASGLLSSGGITGIGSTTTPANGNNTTVTVAAAAGRTVVAWSPNFTGRSQTLTADANGSFTIGGISASDPVAWYYIY